MNILYFNASTFIEFLKWDFGMKEHHNELKEMIYRNVSLLRRYGTKTTGQFGFIPNPDRYNL
jgi:hypothetical protein